MRFRPLDAWPRQRRRSHDSSPFTAGWTSTVKLLERELDQLQARNAVILVDCPESDIRIDGTYPKANARVDYPGVVVAFDSMHGPLKYVADRYRHWQDNVRAIALGLEALRKVDRYGITSRGEQYTGWAALPAGPESMSRGEAARLLAEHGGPDDEPTEDQVDRLTKWIKDGTLEAALDGFYRNAVKRLHPDRGGDPELFQRLQRARELLKDRPRAIARGR